MSFGLVYLVPIGFGAWYAGSVAGVVLSALAALGWFFAEDSKMGQEGHLVFVWNACSRFAVFLVITAALSRIRTLQAELRALVKKQTEKLESETAQRMAVERELVATSHREQCRIGHELHDGLGQYLAGISFRAKALEQSLTENGLPQAGEARELMRLAGSAINQARDLARGLDPLDLEDNDLVAALRNLASTAGATFGIECAFRWQDTGSALQVDKEIALALYRISQEAIHNAFKHGQARHVVLDLSAQNGALDLRVTDDGKGLSSAPQHEKGTGLRIMRYRADAVGGTLEIKPGTEHGFEIRCVVPAGRWSHQATTS